MNPPFFRVIFRACDKVNAVNMQPRPFGLSKADVIKICFRSLHEALKPVPHTIDVLGDKLSEDMMDFFSGYDVNLSNGDYGNDESIRQSVKCALSYTDGEDWIYFCEDDYLHRPETFVYISNLIKASDEIQPQTLPKKKGLFRRNPKPEKPALAIFPSDYPDRYWPQDRTQNYIFLTEDCHWRQLHNTTFTLMLQQKDVKRFEQVLMKASVGADDGYLSRSLYGREKFKNKLLLLCPLPGLSSHMHVYTMTPLVDWQAFIERYSA